MSDKNHLKRKIKENRSLRVNITYEMEAACDPSERELPFVVGVLGDFVGNREEELPSFKKRKFIEIDEDNLDPVMKLAMKPRLIYTVANKLQKDQNNLSIELKFNNMADFEPDNFIPQIAPLHDLVKIRQNLSALLNELETNTNLEKLLERIYSDPAKQKELKILLQR